MVSLKIEDLKGLFNMFEQGKMKALTFSYDDGIEQDKRLVDLFNYYGMKCTFNINSGLQTGASTWNNSGVQIKRMNIKGLKDLYQGHEIASHTLTHPHLNDLDEDTIYNEIIQDKINLANIFEKEITGFAYPFGNYNEKVIEVIKKCGIKYARTVGNTYAFDIPEDLHTYAPTCHHKYPELMNLARKFVDLKPNKPQVFYVWGHSYEFDVDNNWSIIEEFCEYMAGKDDIYYGTNSQVLL